MSTVNLSEKFLWDSVSMRFKAYLDLLKFRLSALVTFSAVFGFILGHHGQSFSWSGFIGLVVGGFLISGASGAANEIKERDYDKLMKRTQTRPLPMEIISVREAIWFSIIAAVLGVSLLAVFTNILTTCLGILMSLFIPHLKELDR